MNKVAKQKYCKHCNRETLHEEFENKSVSAGKVFLGLASAGLSLFATGVKKGKGYYCTLCKTVY